LHRPLARAAALARGNGGTLVVFGGLSALFGLLGPDPLSLIVGAIVVTVGLLERRGGRQLRQADPGAPRRLAANELALLAAISTYAILSLTLLRPSGAELVAATGGNVAGLDVQELLDSLTNVVYATVLVVTVLYQGGLARYYLARRAPLALYRESVPPWAREIVEGLAG